MRFTGRIGDNGGSFSKDSRHNGIFRRGYRRFIKENILTLKLVCREGKLPVYIHSCAKFGKCEEVGIKTATADNISSRRRQHRFPGPGKERSGKKD